jgi:hypothetical protein
MAKENYDGMQFRLNFISEGGHLLATTEWTTDKDKIIFLADEVNKSKRIRAMPETKGTGYASTVDEEGRFRLVK